jgi:hypothetical protein
MSFEKNVRITDVQYQESTKLIYVTTTTHIYETEGDVRTLISSKHHKDTYSGLEKQEALGLENNIVTAIVNEVFTDEYVAFLNRELPEGRTEEEMMELYG